MSKLLSAREIATLALRTIGVVTPTDTSAPEGKLQIALQILDLILAEKAGTTRIWSLVPQNLTFNYTANANSVDITSLLGAANALDVFRHAYEDVTDDEIVLVRRDEFDLFQNSGIFPFTLAKFLYIASDGDDTYTAYLRPVPTVDTVVRVTGQKFSPTVTNATNSNSELAHGFERAWQRWMVYSLSADAGNGPLARLPEDRLIDYRGIASDSWAHLNTYRGGGQRKAARFTRSWDP